MVRNTRVNENSFHLPPETSVTIHMIWMVIYSVCGVKIMESKEVDSHDYL